MKTALSEKLIAVCESLGWTIREYDDGSAELFQTSPAGEDFSVCVRTENFAEEICAYYEDFDPEEHAVMWYGRRGAPNLHTLIEDADAIDSMLEDLAIAVTQADYESNETND